VITSRTKRQLLAFVILTLVGVSYVGARYAQLDRLFYDSAYTVNAHFKESGGIFTGAEVTYRGVGIGQVSDMQLIDGGVNVKLAIDRAHDRIPADTAALVGNKSAVGEQYVELQPRTSSGPYLKDGSVIRPQDTQTPVSTKELLTNLTNLVNSVDQSDLRTVVSELGAAFHGTGEDLARIIDTGNEFIQAADDNFKVTTDLIRDSNTVLRTQADKGSAIRSFARDLELFSNTLSAHDKDLRTLIENGSATTTELRRFLEDNQVNLGQLLNNLVTTNEVVVQYLDGIQQLLILYPYVVAGGYTVAARNDDGTYNANFGLVLTQGSDPCKNGYDPAERRDPTDRSDKPMDEDAHCADPPSYSNPRGAQNAPAPRAPVGTYDVGTGKFSWGQGESGADVVYDGGAAQLFGKDSWKWMLLQPTTGARQ
jgi:phospholipid/cholesterol/gamma-HCH transport system substrate-binding protein